MGVATHGKRTVVTVHGTCTRDFIAVEFRASEFVFTLIRQPGVSDDQFAKGKAAVENDLKTLKELLERKP